MLDRGDGSKPQIDGEAEPIDMNRRAGLDALRLKRSLTSLPSRTSDVGWVMLRPLESCPRDYHRGPKLSEVLRTPQN